MPDDPKVTRDTSGRSIREADRRQREEYERDEPEAPVSRESTAPLWGQVRSKGQTARTVVGLMAFTTVFALISTEIEGFADPKKASGGVRILIGGGVATILLLVIAEAGDAGAQLAEGLAVVTTVAAVLVKGGPVWNWAASNFGSRGTTPTSGTTATGGYGTNPQGGPANVVAGASQVGPPNPNGPLGLPTPGHPTTPTGVTG